MQLIRFTIAACLIPLTVPLLGDPNFQRPSTLQSLVQCILHFRVLGFLPSFFQTLDTVSHYLSTIKTCLSLQYEADLKGSRYVGMLSADSYLIWYVSWLMSVWPTASILAKWQVDINLSRSLLIGPYQYLLTLPTHESSPRTDFSSHFSLWCLQRLG